MRRLRGPNADDADLAAEVEEIRVADQHEKESTKGVSFLQIFRGSDLRRTLIAIGLQCLQQAQGISFMVRCLYLPQLSQTIDFLSQNVSSKDPILD